MEESTMVLEESRPYLKALAELAPQLNEATDRYMEELKTIEAELSQLNIGLPVELDEELDGVRDRKELDEHDETVQYRYLSKLAYERLGSAWGFSIRDYRGTKSHDGWNDYDWTEIDVTPLRNAPRDIRLAVAGHIPALLKKIEETVKATLAVAKKATNR